MSYECEALIDTYRSRAGTDGQVSMRMPSAKLGGQILPWCVNNLDHTDITYDHSLFD
ncbi:hypothetical protein [Parasphingopyxis sp.]|uniref:hypothetical protein n=1 Tax=Parasphingopyxis sp. TaxID=1920299 RepID=UPI0032EF9AF7